MSQAWMDRVRSRDLPARKLLTCLMAMSTIRYWHSLTSPEASGLAEQNPVAILPLAAIEQHGPHLPLSTDLDIGLGLLANAFGHLSENFAAWALPPQSVGASQEHTQFAGTLHLSPNVLSRIIQYYGIALARSGVRRLLISNSHGGNRPSVEAAALRLRFEQKQLVVIFNYTDIAPPDSLSLPSNEVHHGFHGGAIETAMMQHLHPDRVRTKHIRQFDSFGEELQKKGSTVKPVGAASFAWLAKDLNPCGAVGDATLATAAMGQALVEHYGRILASVIRDVQNFPLDNLSQ